ncbi:MAG: iron hydrogenase small subunit [Calditrichaceae bacterium]|nr:iron hydrogenase small subunit [Calditrichaceae bacterium]
MIEIEVNNRKVKAEAGEMILSALERAGVKVPTLCHMKDLVPSGACRICSVEVEGYKNLVPSCSYPVLEGMKIKTNSPRAIRARKTIIELLLANHLQDCLYCVRNGDCELQTLAIQYGVREKRYLADRCEHFLDMSSPAIVRDQNKCILCGKCVRVCEEIMGVSAIDFINRGSKTVIAPAFNQSMNVSSCINCGQCVMVCPTGALREKSSLKEVTDALHDPDKFVIVQHAPALSVTLAEEFGMKPGADIDKKIVNAFRRLGFNRVFDTSYSADLTIMEEASELVSRIQSNGVLPMMTSCSPGWIKYVEQFYPEFIPNISTCKSPQQMLGALIKNYYAQNEGLDPAKVFSVAIMPCTAKKFEAKRPEMSWNNIADIDAVLTTRELARLIKMYGIEFDSLVPNEPDMPFGKRSSAGKLFGGTGGVMEAAIRTAHYLITNREMDDLVVKEVRGLKGIKEMKITIDGMVLGVAVASGIMNAQKILEEIKAGRNDLHFIEVMTCPGGCIAGGGQPFNTDQKKITARMQALYSIDQNEITRASHLNKAVADLYKDFLEKPLSERSHQLLHTHYSEREVMV